MLAADPPSSRPQRSSRPLRVLVVTRIFPNLVEPLACAFARQQLAALARTCRVEVLATIPFVAGASWLGERTRPGRLARVPALEEIDGLRVLHPRVPYLPGAGSALAPVNAPLYLAGLLPYLESLRGRFDVVVGSYLYPDACAASMLARILGIPYGVKTHGTDVNLVARWTSVRPILRRVLRSASVTIGVSRPIVEALIELGAPPDRAVHVRNGVDRDVFRPRDRGEARRGLGLPDDGPIIGFVGRLEKEKGVRDLLDAFAALEQALASGARRAPRLVFVGDGSLRAEIERARSERVHAAGAHPLEKVARFLAAFDVLALPSWAEGTPNVVLEALAVGRPVVATNVGGIPDVVAHGTTGLLVPPHDAPVLAEALGAALARDWSEQALVASAPPSWEESAASLAEALRAAVRLDRRARELAAAPRRPLRHLPPARARARELRVDELPSSSRRPEHRPSSWPRARPAGEG